jgi:hypothetical protein
MRAAETYTRRLSRAGDSLDRGFAGASDKRFRTVSAMGVSKLIVVSNDRALRLALAPSQHDETMFASKTRKFLDA